MKRVFNPYIYIMLLSVAGLAGMIGIRSMDGVRSAARDGIAMDTVVKLAVTGSKSRAELSAIQDEAFALLDALEKKLSMYEPGSQISRINQAAGADSIAIDRDLFELLRRSAEIAGLTDGAFDPTIGPVTALWKEYRESGGGAAASLPPVEDLRSAAALVGYDGLVLTPPDRARLKRPGMMLDLGAVGKGYASEVLWRFLSSHNIHSALIDLGGNIVAVGRRPDGNAWRIGVQDPEKPRGAPLLSLEVRNAAVITSGVYERAWEIDGRVYTHIFAPHSGMPLEGELRSVTIVTSDPVEGDALSTAFMVMGEARALDLLRVVPGVDAIFVSIAADGGRKVVATGGLKGSLHLLNDACDLVYHDVQ